MLEAVKNQQATGEDHLTHTHKSLYYHMQDIP